MIDPGIIATVFSTTLNLLDRLNPIKPHDSLIKYKRLRPGFEVGFDKASIFSMLSWQSDLSDFVGRGVPMADLIEWAHSDKMVSVKFITGDGGIGKSRLAGEFARELAKAEGWEAGFYSLDNPWDVPLGEIGTLLIVDYPEKMPDKVEMLLQVVAELPSDYRVRVLFLTRTSIDEWLGRIDAAGADRRIDETAIELGPVRLSVEDALCICNSVAQNAAKIFMETGQISAPPRPLELEELEDWIAQDADEHNGRPLFLVAAGIHAALSPDDEPLTIAAKDMVMSLVRRENKRIRLTSSAVGGFNETLSCLLAMATIAGELPWETIRKLDVSLRKELGIPDRWNAREALQEAGWLCGESFLAVQPDIVGAGFVSEVLDKNSHMDKKLVLQAVFNALDKQWTENLCRIKTDMRTVLGKMTTPIELLAEHIKAHDELDERLAFLASHDGPHGLAPLSIAVGEKQLLQEGINDAERAARPNNLSVHYASNGDSIKAMRICIEAVDIWEKLTKTHRGEFLPELAGSLQNLSIRYSDIGDNEKAMETNKRALKIREKLILEDNEKFLPDLAESYNSLSIRYSEIGKNEKAMEASKRAVKEYEKLVQINEAEFLPDLAMSLNNLSNRYFAIGDSERAMKICKQAVNKFEKLAQKNEAKFLPDLVRSLNNLSNRYSGIGDYEKAIEVSKRAVKESERLAQENPMKFLPMLAITFGTYGNILMESGNSLQAIPIFKRAQDMVRPFAEQYPGSPPDRTYQALMHNLTIAQEAD